MSILLDKVTKGYGKQPVLKDFSLEIQTGELFVLLGASGSGKSTLLRLIAGLAPVESGRILLHGQDVTSLPAQQRNVGYVFQNYSLFQHMTVVQNIEFGLEVRRIPRTERSQRVAELLTLIEMEAFGQRMPSELSGGEQQRVALARALAYQPDVLLLDEPFGALDSKIRKQLRLKLREIQRTLNVTTILVTHDEEEAFELADRIGTVQQGAYLASTFDKMSKALAKSYADLERQTRELEVAYALAKESLRLKSEFMATMSHELRTPLNAISGFSSILLAGMGGQIDEDARHMIERINTNSSHLLTLINDVLDLAKIDAERLTLASVPISPQHFVSNLQKQVGILPEQKGLKFEVELDPELPDKVLGDPDRLSQITLNLLSNAFKFTEQGSVKLALKKAGDLWAIEVSDTGIGIPSDALKYIFDEFRQVDGSSQRAHGGTGLGLAIVRKLVQMMDGNVQVKSVPGVGSTFIVTLPLRSVLELATAG